MAFIRSHQLKVLPSEDQLIQKVQIKTAKDREQKFFKRPVHKLVLLLAHLFSLLFLTNEETFREAV